MYSLYVDVTDIIPLLYENWHKTYIKHINCKLYYQQLHLKYLCNLATYWLQAVWGWHDNVETCSSVIICEIIVHLLVIVQNNKRCIVHVKHLDCKLYYQQLHLKYLCNLARYWLQAVWGWHNSVETCSSVIICEIIVHLLVIVQNNNRCTVHGIKIVNFFSSLACHFTRTYQYSFIKIQLMHITCCVNSK
jgi:hypothetical protein